MQRYEKQLPKPTRDIISHTSYCAESADSFSSAAGEILNELFAGCRVERR